jgi:hypothetical protein
MAASRVFVKKILKPNGFRYYQIGNTGKVFPSVTSVIQAVLNKPLINQWERRLILDSFKQRVLAMQNNKHDKIRHFAEQELDEVKFDPSLFIFIIDVDYFVFCFLFIWFGLVLKRCLSSLAQCADHH